METYDGVPPPSEQQRSYPNNSSVSCLPLRNSRQRKRLGCGIGSVDGNDGGGNGVIPGRTDTESRMAAACSSGGGDGGEREAGANCEEIK